ncbi:MAG: helix-turn-helix transcriptional regulator [Pseudomonadota bacterium]
MARSLSTNKPISELETPGARLKRIRESSGLTQEELGDQLGCTQQTVFRYESGSRKLSISVLLELSSIFGVPPAFFIPDGDGLTDEERELIQWLRDHPRESAVVKSTLRSLKDTYSSNGNGVPE